MACAAAIVASSLTMVDCLRCSAEPLCYPRRPTIPSLKWERGNLPVRARCPRRVSHRRRPARIRKSERLMVEENIVICTSDRL